MTALSEVRTQNCRNRQLIYDINSNTPVTSPKPTLTASKMSSDDEASQLVRRSLRIQERQRAAALAGPPTPETDLERYKKLAERLQNDVDNLQKLKERALDERDEQRRLRKREARKANQREDKLSAALEDAQRRLVAVTIK